MRRDFAEVEITDKIYDWKLMKRILAYARPYTGLIAVSILLLIIVSGVIILRPYLIKVAIDDHILGDQDYSSILRLVVIYFSLITMSFLINYLQNYILNLTSQKIMHDIRGAIFSHLQKLSVSFFDKNPVGRLVTRVTNDTANLEEMFTEVLIGLIKDTILVIGIIVVMLMLDVKLALISLIAIPLILLSTQLYKNMAQGAFRTARTRLAALNSALQENIVGMRIVQIFNQQANRFSEFNQINKDYLKAELKAIKAHAIYRPSMDVIFFSLLALLIFIGGREVMENSVQLGVLYAIINYTERLFQPINDMTQKYTMFQSAVVSSERIFLLLDEKEVIADVKSPSALPEVWGKVEFKNVWFAYNNNNDWVLKDVSFEINQGETVALVGPTGSGKTTVVNLLNRFYDIQKGHILIDDVPIESLRQADLRAGIATVMQDVFLFSGDILSNIQLDSEQISIEQVKQSAKYVGAEDFIVNLPGGYRYNVKERGITLSVGQKQLISFARALAFNGAILVLDEATANIDSQTESLIQETLKKVSRNKTTIIVAHRLSTIQHVDKILVFQHGKIVEAGNHQDLLRRRGVYYRLFQLQ